MNSLAEFGAPLHDLTAKDLVEPGLIFQIGVPPIRIDVITAIDGVEFSDAWPDRIQTRISVKPMDYLGPTPMAIVYSGKERYRVHERVEVIPLDEALTCPPFQRSASRRGKR